jgi:hypothetical protein
MSGSLHMKSTVILSAVIMAATATAAMAARDNFDRADLGKRWVVPAGDGRLFITNDELQGDTLSLGYDKKSSSDTTVKATLYLGGTDIEYGAVASGDIASSNNAFVKLQADNGSGKFDAAGFYTGNDVEGPFFLLDSPVPSPATVTLSFCGTVATLKIKSAAGKQVYQYDYGTSFGTGGGLGTVGKISIDNYRSSPDTGCEDAIGIKGTIRITHSTAKDVTLTKWSREVQM